MPLILKRDRDLGKGRGEFYVVCDENGACVGRVFNGFPDLKDNSGKPWFWGLEFHAARGVRPFYGHAATRELAMAEFRVVWNSRPPSPVNPGSMVFCDSSLETSPPYDRRATDHEIGGTALSYNH